MPILNPQIDPTEKLLASKTAAEVKEAIRMGADVNYFSNSSEFASEIIIRSLVSQENAKTPDGVKNLTEVVTTLLDNNAPFMAESAQMLVGNDFTPALTELLTRMPGLASARDQIDDDTCIYMAALNNNVEIVKLGLKCLCDPREESRLGASLENLVNKPDNEYRQFSPELKDAVKSAATTWNFADSIENVPNLPRSEVRGAINASVSELPLSAVNDIRKEENMAILENMFGSVVQSMVKQAMDSKLILSNANTQEMQGAINREAAQTQAIPSQSRRGQQANEIE